MTDFHAHLRAQFALLNHPVNGKKLVYLDSAATSQKPQVVIDALADFYRHDNANVHRGGYFLGAQATQKYENARAQVAQFLNTQPENIVFTRGTTEAINLVAHSFGAAFIRAGDEIALTHAEHHANIVPWQLLAQRCGAVLKVACQNPDGSVDLQHLGQQLTPRTRLVAVAHAYNTTGAINDIGTICQIAHANNSKVLIDGAQAVAHLAVDVALLDCDFYCFSGHKIFAPTGIGVLYGKGDLLNAMEPWHGGGEMIKNVSFTKTTFAPPPYKFEAGTPPIGAAIALGVALEWLQSQPRAQILEHELRLAEHLYKGLATVPDVHILNAPAAINAANPRLAIASFYLQNQHPADTAAFLDHHGIALRAGSHCAQPFYQQHQLKGALRASLGCYNSVDEVDFLIATLKQARAQPRQARADAAYIDATATQGHLYQKLAAEQLSSQRQRQLLLLGQKLPPMAAQFKTDAHLIAECQSAVWLHCEWVAGKVHIHADSDANIIRALIALILDSWQNQSPELIQAADFQAKFQQLHLSHLLSPSRSNGINAVIARICQFAQNPL